MKEKIGILWERSEHVEKTLDKVLEELQDVQVKLAEIRYNTAEIVERECVTKKELSAVKAATTFTAGLVAACISVISFIVGFA